MEVIERREEDGNQIFEAGQKRISFDAALLGKLAKKKISITNLDIEGVAGQTMLGGDIVYLNFSHFIEQGGSNSSIGRKIVNSLAHEIRHIFQTKIGFIDDLALSLSSIARFSRWISFHLVTAGLVFNFLYLFFYSDLWIISVVFWTLAAVIWMPWLIYYFSPNERDARRFARQALKNNEWLEVVKVEDKDTS